MRKMKKLLAWLTVVTVNVSMMPMPTVAAAPITDADATTASEESAASDATKEASKAQEAAEKAVKEASKAAATTTAAKKTTTVTKKATTKKAKSEQSLEDTIEEGIFQDRDHTKIDVESYDASKSEVKKATKDVLKDNNASKLVDVTYDTNAEGKVESVNVETDAAFMKAMDEIDELNEANDGTATEEQLQDAYKTYAGLQYYYEQKPDYFGIAAPYFTAKDTEGEGPIRAILSVADIEFDEIGTSEKNSVETVTGLIQGYYYMLVQMTDGTGEFDPEGKNQKGQLYDMYGAKLLEVRDQALEAVEGKKTTAEKLLALNDWLGNYATFDMGYINNQMKADIEGGGNSGAMTQEDLLAGVVRSSAFGVLVNKKSVCLSYTAAYNYLVQCAFPEIYKNKDGSWKKKDEINGTWEVKKDADGNVEKFQGKTQYQLAKDSATPTYMVDYVRIQWDSKVKMYGKKQDFNNPHYFSAVKVPNKDEELKWYYVDSCYNDIYVECLQRNRVETDGNLPHSYFLISDASLRQQFDGNYQYIDTLYKDDSTDTTYEDSWVSKAQGPVYSDGTYYYYVKNTSTYNSSTTDYDKKADQLVRRNCSDGLLGGEDTVLIDYETGKGLVEKGKGANLVTDKYEKETENNKKYPGLTHSAALYNNALYLNVDNQILKYDLANNTITKVKEYNEVSAKQDENLKDFEGMSFKITSNDDKDKVHTVYNHPIAGLAIKDDGKMYVSIATNFTDCAKYKYEETNYNSEYMNYSIGGHTVAKGGDNDNQEFMWSANFTETLEMSHLTGTSHKYEEVEVAPTCTESGYKEYRCTECGKTQEDGETTETGKEATGHHYIKAHEFYYTPKNDQVDYSEENRNEGDFYVCTDCLDAKDTLPEGVKAGHTYGNATLKWTKDNKSEAEVTVSCTVCKDKELDALLDDQNKETQEKELTKTATTTEIEVEKPEDFDCEKGGTVTYVATATIDGEKYSAKEDATVEAGQHQYGDPKFTWTDDNKATAEFTCSVCGKTVSKECTVEAKTTPATCTEVGKTVYTATVEGSDKTDTKEVEIPALGHDYGTPEFKWTDDHKATATFTCKNDPKDVQTKDCEVTPKTTKEVTCTENGEIVYTATCEFDGKTYTSEEKEVVKATGHVFEGPTYTWSTDDNGKAICAATFNCKNGDIKDYNVIVKEGTDSDYGTVKAETTAATCETVGSTVYTATIKYDGKTYTDTKEVEIPALGHKYGEPEFTWSSDHKTATAKFTCANDASHVKTENCTITEETTDATCEKAGTVTYIATVKDGNQTYTDKQTVEGTALGHKYGNPEFKWSTDGKTCEATFTCERDRNHIHTEECKVTDEVIAPTCTEKGKTIHTATLTFEGKDYKDTKDTDETAALGHKYGEPKFNWSTDHKTATATFTCANDATHTKTENCVITEETTDATCEKAGTVTYIATVKDGDQTYTDKQTVEGVALGHKYGEPEFKWSEDYKTCEATFTCERDGHVKTENCEVTDEVIAPTCTEKGKTVHTATIKDGDQTYTDTKDTDETAALGHDYDENGVCKVCGHEETRITLKDKKAVYTGKTISVDAATVKGSKGAVTYKYYSDKDCKNEVSAHVNPGVYYVKATVAADDSHMAATSKAVKLTILPQATKVTSVANASSYVTVSWNKVSKASGYDVYRSTDGKKFTKIATVKSAKTVKYSDKKATKNGQKYVYKVVVYYNGNQKVSSAYSAAKTGYRLSTMKVSSLSNKKGKKLYVKWAKNSKSTGYQIEYVTGKTTKTVKVSSAKSTNKTISKLKKGKTYNVRIRSYKKVSGTTYYGAWSGKKKIKIKK